MNLAVITPFPPLETGISQYGYYISREIGHSGAFDKITLITQAQIRPLDNDFGLPSNIQREGVWFPDRWDTGWRILERVRQLKPDIIWFNLGASIFGRSPLANLSGMLAPALCKKLGLQVIITLHELIEQADVTALKAPGGKLAPLGARLLTYLGLQANVICVTLRRQVDWLKRTYPDKPLVHIPHGAFDLPQLLEEETSHDLLFFTHHAPFKGLELLLEAFIQVRSFIPQLTLRIAGADHPRFPGYLQSVQQKYPCVPGVTWLGRVPESSLKQLFAKTTIVVLPYTATTGASSVLYRAATWGRSIVCSNLPELRAAAEEAGLRAEFFSTGDVTSLEQSLLRMLTEPHSRQTQVLHNHHILSRHSLEITGQAYLHAFEMLQPGKVITRFPLTLYESREVP